MSGTKIQKLKKISITDQINVYNKPSRVYIPLINQDDTDVTIMVKKGDYVLKGTVVGKSKGNLRIPIYSSVSGVVLDFEEKLYLNGKNVKCVVIENDFKEKVEKRTGVKKDINNYSHEEFIEIIKEAGIIGMGGSGFPTYVKYNTDNKIKTLIFNAVECEPYLTSDYMMLMHKTEEILETIDAIIEINDIDEAIIAIKKGNNEVKKHITNFIGTYLKIKLVEVADLYPMGWERRLIKEIKNVTYTKLPLEQGIIVSNLSTIYAIYEALKYEKPLTERLVTFSGDMINVPQNILVKIGTPIKDIIEYIGGYKNDNDVHLIAGGPMMGKAMPSDNLVVTGNLNGVIALSFKEEKPIPCINCGKCVSVCPVYLSPVLIMKSLKKNKITKYLEPNRCIECGLCSYICPSKITVREFVTAAKKRVNEEDK